MEMLCRVGIKASNFWNKIYRETVDAYYAMYRKKVTEFQVLDIKWRQESNIRNNRSAKYRRYPATCCEYRCRAG